MCRVHLGHWSPSWLLTTRVHVSSPSRKHGDRDPTPKQRSSSRLFPRLRQVTSLPPVPASFHDKLISRRAQASESTPMATKIYIVWVLAFLSSHSLLQQLSWFLHPAIIMRRDCGDYVLCSYLGEFLIFLGDSFFSWGIPDAAFGSVHRGEIST
jgi:hypothetical protein